MYHKPHKTLNELEHVSMRIEDCGGLKRIEKLQNHHNIDIFHKCLAIIDQYFETNGDEDLELSTSTYSLGIWGYSF